MQKDKKETSIEVRTKTSETKFICYFKIVQKSILLRLNIYDFEYHPNSRQKFRILGAKTFQKQT